MFLVDKGDPFDKEKQTIEALLSQWTEEDIPESELTFPKTELPCFNSTVIEETKQIFQPVTAVPVSVATVPQDSEAVIVELGGLKQELSLPGGVSPLPQSVAPLTQSVAPSPQTVAALSQSVATLSQSVAPMSQRAAPLSQSVSSLPQSVTSLPQSVARLPQSVAPLPQSVASLPQSVAPLPQNVASLPQSVAVLTQGGSSMPVNVMVALPQSSNDVVMADAEAHADNHGSIPSNGQFLPVEGGYILVEENTVPGKKTLY